MEPACAPEILETYRGGLACLLKIEGKKEEQYADGLITTPPVKLPEYIPAQSQLLIGDLRTAFLNDVFQLLPRSGSDSFIPDIEIQLDTCIGTYIVDIIRTDGHPGFIAYGQLTV